MWLMTGDFGKNSVRVLSLFSGGGLGDYGLELSGMEIVGQVEIDDYCQKILKLRWPKVPKWTDIRSVDSWDVFARSGQIDVISGGFPCQDISTAGKGAGITGERSGLWKEMHRIIREIRPRYVLVENVTALLGRGLGTVLGDLAEIGYDTEWVCVSSENLGADHERERIWVVAYPNSIGCGQPENERQQPWRAKTIRPGKVISKREASINQSPKIFIGQIPCGKSQWIDSERGICRVSHGTPNRIHRLAAIGNGQDVRAVRWVGQKIRCFDEKLQNVR